METNFKDWIKKDYLYIVSLLLCFILIVYLIGVGSNHNNTCNKHWIEQVQPVIDECPAYAPDEFNNFTDDINYLYIMEGDMNE
jgi:hypothetical protein